MREDRNAQKRNYSLSLIYISTLYHKVCTERREARRNKIVLPLPAKHVGIGDVPSQKNNYRDRSNM